MKTQIKTPLTTLVAAVCMAGFLAGCAADAKEIAPAPTASEEVHADAMPGIANPWTDASKEEIETVIGAQVMLPEGAENVSYRILAAEGIADVSYDLDGEHISHRMKKTDAFEDISGLYYTWQTTEDTEYEGCPAQISRFESDEETVELTLWLEDGVMHAMSCVE